jgi:hypothetical protein
LLSLLTGMKAFETNVERKSSLFEFVILQGDHIGVGIQPDRNSFHCHLAAEIVHGIVSLGFVEMAFTGLQALAGQRQLVLVARSNLLAPSTLAPVPAPGHEIV